MSVTEEVAKTKICPFVTQPGNKAMCVASSCMVWVSDEPAGEVGSPVVTGYCGMTPPPAAPAIIP